jgi:phosphoglycolate phosphatase-like HAD superfamily hydrolase
MVGDSLVDYETAAAVSAKCCLAAYGFGRHSLEGVSTGDAWVVSDAAGLSDVIRLFAVP